MSKVMLDSCNALMPRSRSAVLLPGKEFLTQCCLIRCGDVALLLRAPPKVKNDSWNSEAVSSDACGSGKSIILGVGESSPSHNYSLNDTSLDSSRRGRDSGVLVGSDFRLRARCIQAKNRAHRVWGIVIKIVINNSAELILKIHLALARPHFICAAQFWSPNYRMNIKRLESVQRMTERIQGLINLS